jgi:hypothetical protein
MDDITPEAEVAESNTLEFNTQKFKPYFVASEEMKDETEVSDINEEELPKNMQN